MRTQKQNLVKAEKKTYYPKLWISTLHVKRSSIPFEQTHPTRQDLQHLIQQPLDSSLMFSKL